ncbi:MAG TPA: hypothetical protein VFI46_07665, partial [Jiangellaceae bacterium]|nr:hypothetical protein [Jiangellaceae bacterium]
NRRLHAQRRLRRWTDAEGGWNLSARGTPQAGAAFNTAIDPIIDALFQDARRAGRREPVEAHGFDALIHLAEPPPADAAATHHRRQLRTRPAPRTAGSPPQWPRPRRLSRRGVP